MIQMAERFIIKEHNYFNDWKDIVMGNNPVK